METRIPSLPEEVFRRDRDILMKSFSFEGKKKTVVLFIHGWTSTPYEFRDLGKYLQKHGYAVCAPLLSGHGTTPKDLKTVTLEDWMEDIRKQYDRLAKSYDHIFVGGSSFGGTLSLLLASERLVCGLILIGTPYRLKNEWLLQLGARFFLLLNKRHQRKAYIKTWNALLEEHRCISYPWYPVKNGLEVLRGVAWSRIVIPKLSLPAFLFQSRHDHVISLSSIDNLQNALPSSDIVRHETEKKLHTFLVDEELRNDLYPNILNFLDRVGRKK
jgi:carboxylesterase